MASLLNNASLLLNPAGSIISYQEDKIYSVLPKDGTGDFTFSGGDGGTRVNQQGYIEQTPANLLSYSSNFSGYNSQGTFTSGHSDPQGGNTAFLRTSGNIWANQSWMQAGVTYTTSVWLKSDTGGNITVNLNDGFSGTVATFTVTPEWKLYTHTVPAINNGGSFYLYSWSGNGYIWGPMINIGSTAKPYQPTTDRLNYPRITYQNGRGALLSEPQRTNVNTYSQDFTNAVWGKYSVTVTGSAAISPDGTMNATKLVLTATSGELGTGSPVSNGYTTIFAKAGNVGRFSLYRGNTSFGTEFNLYNGTVISGTGTIEPYKDGWYRIGVKMDANRSINPYFAGGYAVGDFVYIWGAQSEEGNYPTTYIPTTSATVTRPIDQALDTSLSTVLNTSEGVLYFDFEYNGNTSYYLWAINDGTNGNRVQVEVNMSTNTLNWILASGGTLYTLTSTSGMIPGKRYKSALAYKVNDVVGYLNGVQQFTDSSAVMPTALNRFEIGSEPGAPIYVGGKCFTGGTFNTRLTNTQLAELTTVRSGSGGNISYNGPYTVHTFTGSATFTPSFNGEVEVLVVAGGGGGGARHGGGGGAGGLLYASSYGVSQGTGVTVTIGAGGPGVNPGALGDCGINGSNSVFGGLTAIGGGGGGSYTSPVPTGGASGGGGGGGLNTTAGSSIVGQGNPGGTGGAITGGGGGGGAGAAGSNAAGANTGGNGGNGLPYSITGYSTYYAGGGGGGSEPTQANTSGGLGGGGTGDGQNQNGGAGVAYTGGGGGGTRSATTSLIGGTGGAGIVIVRYLT